MHPAGCTSPRGVPRSRGNYLHGQGGPGLALPGLHMEVSSPPIGCGSPWGSTAALSSHAAPPRSEPLPLSTVPPCSPSCSSPARRDLSPRRGEVCQGLGQSGAGSARPRPLPRGRREEGHTAGLRAAKSRRGTSRRWDPADSPALNGPGRAAGPFHSSFHPSIHPSPLIPGYWRFCRHLGAFIRLSPALGACRDLNAFFFFFALFGSHPAVLLGSSWPLCSGITPTGAPRPYMVSGMTQMWIACMPVQDLTPIVSLKSLTII